MLPEFVTRFAKSFKRGTISSIAHKLASKSNKGPLVARENNVQILI